MFQLDDKFLQDLGLEALPQDQRQAFLQHVYEELELRVGTKLSEGLKDIQLEEFEKIIDKKKEAITDWLKQNAPDYKKDELFLRLRKVSQADKDDESLRNEYAATKWLEINRPNYRQVVATVLSKLKQEIIDNRDTILGNLSD
ncbi:MAG: DUF5663 domain-containing protein [Candidatus Paceibacterota bacterium]|jgi:hypothetical protein